MSETTATSPERPPQCGITVTLPEDHRQAVLLAIAQLANARPGWDAYLLEIANKLHGAEMYAEFKSLDPNAPPEVKPGTQCDDPEMYAAAEVLLRKLHAQRAPAFSLMAYADEARTIPLGCVIAALGPGGADAIIKLNDVLEKGGAL